MDKMVQDVQQWLNDTWPDKFKYDETGVESGSFPVEPDGMTGNTTVKALVMALQLRLNLTADGAFGPLLQGCINTFKEDLGRPENNQLTPLEFKSLLTTDPTIKVSAGTYEIRAVQQYLNHNYGNLYVENLGYLPTGGIFERKTAKALIYAFQNIIGTAADGAIGNNTYSAMPSINRNTTDSNFVKILQCALTCNGYTIVGRYLTGTVKTTSGTRVSKGINTCGNSSHYKCRA